MKAQLFNLRMIVCFSTIIVVSSFAYAQDRFSGFENREVGDQQKFAELTQRVTERWGRFLESTVPQWVQYSSDLNSEVVVEFEKGYVEIAVLQNIDDVSGIKTQQRMQQELTKLIDFRTNPDLPPLLSEQVNLNNVLLEKKNIQQMWPQIKSQVVVTPIRHVQKTQPRFRPIPSEKELPLPKVKQVLRIPLAPNHIKKRAHNFLPLVQEYSKEFNLDPELVLAVIHTESYFNPRAKSSVAYGLMQLVPKSGARDAYRKRFGKDRIVSADYLYEPRKNIELGTQYLQILQNKTFGSARDPLKIRYMSISAYNTGAGNVSRALTGTRSISKANKKARLMNSSEFYSVV